jgi:hypothetical protein
MCGGFRIFSRRVTTKKTALLAQGGKNLVGLNQFGFFPGLDVAFLGFGTFTVFLGLDLGVFPGFNFI